MDRAKKKNQGYQPPAKMLKEQESIRACGNKNLNNIMQLIPLHPLFGFVFKDTLLKNKYKIL
tara:strand:- start:8863 stop:9048 length:186 start_codon:yes stop_codon:yes gene_type:complete